MSESVGEEFARLVRDDLEGCLSATDGLHSYPPGQLTIKRVSVIDPKSIPDQWRKVSKHIERFPFVEVVIADTKRPGSLLATHVTTYPVQSDPDDRAALPAAASIAVVNIQENLPHCDEPGMIWF